MLFTYITYNGMLNTMFKCKHSWLYFHHTVCGSLRAILCSKFGSHIYLFISSLTSSLILIKFVSTFAPCSYALQPKKQANTLACLRVNFTQQVESSHNPYPFSYFIWNFRIIHYINLLIFDKSLKEYDGWVFAIYTDEQQLLN